MTKRDWFVVYLPMVFVMLSDQIAKRLAMTLLGVKWFGPLGLALTHNPGAMLGMFSDMPPVLRVVALSTGGGFLLVTFAIIQYLLPLKSLLLRTGLGILLAGILGNVIDRTIWGYVVDFIVFRGFGYTSPVFNLADAYQWVGYGCVVWALFRDGNLLWPETEYRRRYWINPKFQLRYCLKLVGIGVVFATVYGIFSYSYLRVTISELAPQTPPNDLFHRFLAPYLIIHGIVTAAFSAVLFWFGKQASHRIAGPLYAFVRFLQDTIEGGSPTLKLRSGDEFAELEPAAQELQRQIQILQGRLPTTEHPVPPSGTHKTAV